jgi:hypothetical protein
MKKVVEGAWENSGVRSWRVVIAPQQHPFLKIHASPSDMEVKGHDLILVNLSENEGNSITKVKEWGSQS